MMKRIYIICTVLLAITHGALWAQQLPIKKPVKPPQLPSPQLPSKKSILIPPLKIKPELLVQHRPCAVQEKFMFEVWIPNPRFKVNYNGTPSNRSDDLVLDTQSNLVWARDANLTGKKRWQDAVSACENLVLANHDEWKLPSKDEFATLIRQKTDPSTYALPIGHPFINVQYNHWVTQGTTPGGTFYHMVTGEYVFFDKQDYYGVWPVLDCRSYQKLADYPEREEWEVWEPNPRFKINSNCTCSNPSDDLVLDTQSNLVWARDATLGGEKNWQDAASYCENLVIASHGNWRLPTKDELLTLVVPTNTPALPSGHPFINVKLALWYWTRTKDDSQYYPAVSTVDMRDGDTIGWNTSLTGYGWPVWSGDSTKLSEWPAYGQ